MEKERVLRPSRAHSNTHEHKRLVLIYFTISLSLSSSISFEFFATVIHHRRLQNFSSIFTCFFFFFFFWLPFTRRTRHTRINQLIETHRFVPWQCAWNCQSFSRCVSFALCRRFFCVFLFVEKSRGRGTKMKCHCRHHCVQSKAELCTRFAPFICCKTISLFFFSLFHLFVFDENANVSIHTKRSPTLVRTHNSNDKW